jgi:hypothetical protein
MNRCALIVLLAMAPRCAVAQNRSAPDIVQVGIDSFRVHGFRAAVSGWLRGSGLLKSGAPHDETLKVFQDLENAFGQFRDAEVLRVVDMGARMRRTYLAILYETGPGFMTIDCFKADNSWLVFNFTIGAKPDPVLSVFALGTTPN